MSGIERMEVSEEWAHSGVVAAGDSVYVSYCMGHEGQSIIQQMEGAFDVLEQRLTAVGLGLDAVVKMDCLFKDIMDIRHLGDVIKRRFAGNYPSRKAFETRFLREGISFQVDAIAFRGR